MAAMLVSSWRSPAAGVRRLSLSTCSGLSSMRSLNFESLDLAADPGLTISTYTAEAGSRSDHALRLLGSRAATVDPAESSSATDRS